jgi:hypothetical protein
MQILNMSFEDYLSYDAISRSDLNLIEQSPEHYARKSEIHKSSKAMDIGTLFHCFLLEPDVFFEQTYILDRNLDSRKKADKELKNELKLSGKNVIEKKDFELLKKLHEGVRRNRMASKLICGGLPEMTLLGVDEKTGLKIKSRPDYMISVDKKKAIVIDIKTAKSARDVDFMRSLYTNNYHVQQHMITYLLLQKYEQVDFYFVVCEKESLCSCVVYNLSNDIMRFAETKYNNLMAKIKQCKEEGIYEGYENKTLSSTQWR